MKKKVNRIKYILIYFYSYMIHVCINGVNRYEKKNTWKKNTWEKVAYGVSMLHMQMLNL